VLDPEKIKNKSDILNFVSNSSGLVVFRSKFYKQLGRNSIILFKLFQKGNISQIFL
jgi:hypothetical protein